jgi:hypothetical protein
MRKDEALMGHVREINEEINEREAKAKIKPAE